MLAVCTVFELASLPKLFSSFENNRYFFDGNGQWRYFVSFYENEEARRKMKIHLMDALVECKKIKN